MNKNLQQTPRMIKSLLERNSTLALAPSRSFSVVVVPSFFLQILLREKENAVFVYFQLRCFISVSYDSNLLCQKGSGRIKEWVRRGIRIEFRGIVLPSFSWDNNVFSGKNCALFRALCALGFL